SPGACEVCQAHACLVALRHRVPVGPRIFKLAIHKRCRSGRIRGRSTFRHMAVRTLRWGWGISAGRSLLVILPLTDSSPSPKMQRTLTPALLAVICIALFGFGTFFLNYSTLVSIGTNMGLTAVAAGTIVTIMMVAVVAVQPLAPVLNNHSGPRMTFFAALSLQAAGNLLSLLTHFPLFALVSGSVVGGLGFGILVVIGTAAVPSTVAPERLGKALGYF